ncbi:MAG TPA: PcfB family protein [Syntrophorhabdus sp.]|jgi:hypothetical protein|nr:PcfB family protein [Anaerolineaceae bacterium]MDY0126413.1 PcfB family protein [Anaerolineaceae bacterium]HHV05914.1 PcfB family protein [Anaerolineaceae bacterium]HPB39017.1 PcfB family protein [Syntrophorhabdus sp.]
MQEEISQRSVTLIVQTGKMTGKVFLQAIQKYLDILKQQRELKAREKQLHPAYQGRMTIRQLMKERSGLSNIEIHDEHIHDFERIARRYGIEYAIKKERNREAPHYLIFFRSRDTDVLQTAFNEFVKKRLKIQERPSLREKLQKLKLQNKERAAQVPEKVQRKEFVR